MTTPIQTKPLAALDALDLAKQVVAERGEDYVYVNQRGQKAGSVVSEGVGILGTADCSYVHRLPNSELVPGCIVGNVLARWGVSLEVLTSYEACSIGTFGQDAGFADEWATDILAMMQTTQDQGGTWGQALAEGVRRYEQIQEHMKAEAAA